MFSPSIFLSNECFLLGMCNETDVCEYGICHAGGWSCSVIGSYSVSGSLSVGDDESGEEEAPTVTASADEMGQTQLQDWWLLSIAAASFVVATALAVVVGCR